MGIGQGSFKSGGCCSASKPLRVILLLLTGIWIWNAGVMYPANGSPLYPIKASANNRYLVDQNNRPFLIIGDAPHTLLVNLSDADARAYLFNRGSNGYNTLWVELLAG